MNSNASIPAHWSWFYNQLGMFRERILGIQSGHLDTLAESMESSAQGCVDSPSAEADHEVAAELLEENNQLLEEIDAALHRIRDGRYGICEETGQVIPESRLRAVPWTRFSAEAERRREQEAKLRRESAQNPSAD